MADGQAMARARHVIDTEMDKLILAAHERVTRLKDCKMNESQLRNLTNVAHQTRSQEAVTNFVRYQIGRGRDSDPWRTSGFGKSVIEDIERGVVHAISDKATTGFDPADTDRLAVRARVIELYVGYLARCLVYASKTNDWTPPFAEPAKGAVG